MLSRAGAGTLALAAALLGPAVAATPALAATQEQVRPKPAATAAGHMGRLPFNGDGDPARAAPRPAWQHLDRIVYSFDRPARQVLAVDRELSELCRRGRFNQRVNLRYRAFGPGERPLGVAYGHMAINLADPGQRRQADRVYFFKDQDTSRCEVSTARLADLRRWFVGP